MVGILSYTRRKDLGRKEAIYGGISSVTLRPYGTATYDLAHLSSKRDTFDPSMYGSSNYLHDL